MTLKEANEIAAKYGIKITKRGNEYRINHIGGKENTAYYANDIHDAVLTAKMMGGN